MEVCLEEAGKLMMTPYTGKTKRPIKAMHIVLSLLPGGRTTVILDLVRNADRGKYSPFVCCLNELGCPENQVKGIQVEVMNKERGRDHLLPFRLAEVMEAENVHIVHTHEAASLFYGTLAAKLAKTPVTVHTYHRSNDIDIRTKWDRIRNRVMLTLTDGITAVSGANRRVLASAHWISPQRVNLIHNGIDTSKYANVNVDIPRKKEELGLEPNGKIIGAVGRMIGPEKGFDYLIRAFAQISQVHENVKLVIAGDGPLRPELEHLSKDLGVSSRIYFLGFRTDVPELYQIFDIFVLPSTYEAFGLVLVEAMSAGKPVVATNVGGVPEIVQNGKTGVIVPPCDPSRLAEAIAELLKNYDQAMSIGIEGKKHAEEKFSLARMVKDYQNLYSNLLARKLMG